MFYLSFGSNQQDLPSLKKQSPTKFKTFAMLFLSKKNTTKFWVLPSFTNFWTGFYQALPTYKGARSAAIFFHQALPPTTKFQTNSTKFFQASQVLTKFYHQTNAREARRKILPSFTKFYQVSPSFTKFYQVLPSFTKFYQVLPSFTKFHQVLPSFTKFMFFKKKVGEKHLFQAILPWKTLISKPEKGSKTLLLRKLGKTW